MDRLENFPKNQIQMARYELQEPRLYADFNDYFGDILCLTHGDTYMSENGDEVMIREGMIVTAYDEDSNNAGARDERGATPPRNHQKTTR